MLWLWLWWLLRVPVPRLWLRVPVPVPVPVPPTGEWPRVRCGWWWHLLVQSSLNDKSSKSERKKDVTGCPIDVCCVKN